MSDTTTPKRNEAVALWVPNGHVLPDGSWEPGDGTLVFKHEASEFEEQHGFPLYPQSALDALQGEVSRLREALDRLVLAADSAAHSCNTALMDQAIDLARDALNLEPPTDGR